MRQYVAQRKEALGLARRETFVPQSYDWGVEAQVDWYEAYADLDGERVKLQVFSLRSMASGAAYHRAYLRATQQAFLEAHGFLWSWWQGCSRKVRASRRSWKDIRLWIGREWNWRRCTSAPFPAVAARPAGPGRRQSPSVRHGIISPWKSSGEVFDR